MSLVFNTRYTPREIIDLAKEAYDAYGVHTDHKNYQGNPMPLWDDLPESIQMAWRIATEKICSLTETRNVSETRVNVEIDFSSLSIDDRTQIIKQLKWRM